MATDSKKDLEILINKYLEMKCSDENKWKLCEHLTLSDNEKAFKDLLFSRLTEFDGFQNDNQSDDFNRIYNRILTELKHVETRESEKRLLRNRINVRRLILQGLSIAAVFFIAFYLGSRFYPNNQKITPGPYLTIAYTEIKAPLGARSEIKLADGTEVMLNAGSILKYRRDYNSNNRDLLLEGEAYFKVAKNVDLPLVVSAGNINIKATGTEFNVKAYSDEGIIETTLVEGKVEISQKGTSERIWILDPDQKAIYTDETDQLTLEKIREIEPLAVKPSRVLTDKLLVASKTDVEQVTAWTKNKLIIRGENLESLCIKLQRKYNVTFAFGDEEVKKYRFSGVLLDETFEQVMNVILLTAPVDYVLDGKVVTLIANKEQAEKYSKHLKN